MTGVIGARGPARLAAAVILAAAALLAAPIHSAAHALLLVSVPAGGAVLGTPPGAVILEFSAPIDAQLSQATVTDPSGRIVTGTEVSQREMRVDLVTGLPGEYRVSWTSVSTQDGHTTQGAFSFAVEAPSSAQAGVAPVGAPLVPGVLVARWFEDAALLVATGMLFIRWLSRRQPELRWVRMHLLPCLLLALVAGCAVVAAEARAASGGSGSEFLQYLTATFAGRARLVRIAFEALAVLLVARGAAIRWPPVVGALVAVTASGHAAASSPAWWGVTVDAAHLLAAGVWAGGIVALATLRPPLGWRHGGRALLVRFTPWALPMFAATVGLGVLEATGTVGSVSALATTAYGRTLLVKAAGVALLIPLSLAAWRLRRPRLRTEAALAVAVVAAASLLASFPAPAQARPASKPASVPAADEGLPSNQDVTLASHAGQILVGMSIDRDRPGENRLTFYVLPVEGAAAARSLQVTAFIDDRRLALGACGDACREATTALAGGEHVTVTVAGPTGGTANFTVPALPAPSDATLVRLARMRMSRLSTVTYHETLTGGAGVTLTTDYHEAAPNTLQWTQPGGAAFVAVGSTRLVRTSGSSPWNRQTQAEAIPEPEFPWQYFPGTRAAHVVGTSVIQGVPTTVVGFFSGVPGTPLWFEFSIDAQGLVHRMLMIAPGHFMEQDYTGFDAPLAPGLPTR